MTPGAARRGGEGEVIRTAFADCPFGRLLVGTTDKGVCFTCTSGDSKCCEMIQAFCDCLATLLNSGCTCCMLMSNTPVACSCCDTVPAKTSSKR